MCAHRPSSIACERRPGTSEQSATGDILVGMYGSLTGDGASFGQSSVEGAQLAVEEINNAGGLLGGRKIRLLVEDDQSKPEEASNAVTKLITQDKVVAVLGEVASRRSLAAGPVCQKYQVPMITPASTNERVTEIGDYIFRVCFIDPFQGEVLAKFAFNDLKARKVAVLKDIQQDYSVGLTDSIQKTFTALGGQVLDPVSYSSGDADFKAILTQVRAQKPDAIFATGYYPEAAIIVRQARELGMKMPILGGDGWVGDALKNGREALANMLHLEPLLGRQPGSGRPEFPEGLSRQVQPRARFDCRARLRRRQGAGRRHHARGSTDGPKIRDALATADVAGVTGRLKMNASRNVDKPAVIQELQFVNGDVKYVYKTTINPN